MSLVGRILTPAGWRSGRLVFGATIEAIEPIAARADQPAILPGFIDLHVHGGGGGDMMRGAADVRRMARFHARHGTTALLPTSITAAPAALRAAAAGVAAVMARPEPDAAQVLGLHLEGPFISPHRLGAQPPLTRPPDPALFDALAAIAPLRILTMAPELDPEGRFIRHAAAAGCRVQIGHSDASYEQTVAALAQGAAGFTHLFNAMRPFRPRDPGVAGAALAHGESAEAICDLHHVAAGALRVALRAMPGLYGVTDAIEAAGMPDGAYRLGPQPVVKADGCARLADGTLAGSVLTMDQALRNLVGLGLELADAARRLSTLPAACLGLAERGVLRPGARADIVVLDAGLAVRRVVIGGTELAL